MPRHAKENSQRKEARSSTVAGKQPHERTSQVGERERLEAEYDDVMPLAHLHAAKQQIGPQHPRRSPIDLGNPARIVEVMGHDDAGLVALDLDLETIGSP